jgi:CRISPR-associated endonuclease Cas1
MPLDGEISLYESWADRNEYWLAQTRKLATRRNVRDRRQEPLVLCGHGVHLRVDQDTLHVRNGFTHYPQEREEFRFFRGDLNLPPRIVMAGDSGGISFDVLAWLADQGVALIQMDWQGDVVAVIGGRGYAGDAEKIAWQVATRGDERKRLAFSISLIARKIAASIVTLETVIPPSAARNKALEKAKGVLAELEAKPPADLTALRLLEAISANTYFSAWRGLAMNWNANARVPIPDAWRSYSSRASTANGAKFKNVRATHPLNAMLNYAYGVRQSGLQVEAVAAGYDPTIGIMHHGYRGSKAYLFDLMEPERPKIDAAVLAFAEAETFSGADFVIRNDGVCRLAPQLAKRLVQVI